MDETIELVIESPDGIIDCRLEPIREERKLYYSATILYPNIVNGFSRSEIYCYNLSGDTNSGYFFEIGEDTIPSKIKILETQLSEAIINHLYKA